MNGFILGVIAGAAIMAIAVMISITREDYENVADRMAWEAAKVSNQQTYSLLEVMRELGL